MPILPACTAIRAPSSRGGMRFPGEEEQQRHRRRDQPGQQPFGEAGHLHHVFSRSQRHAQKAFRRAAAVYRLSVDRRPPAGQHGQRKHRHTSVVRADDCSGDAVARETEIGRTYVQPAEPVPEDLPIQRAQLHLFQIFRARRATDFHRHLARLEPADLHSVTQGRYGRGTLGLIFRKSVREERRRARGRKRRIRDQQQICRNGDVRPVKQKQQVVYRIQNFRKHIGVVVDAAQYGRIVKTGLPLRPARPGS